MTNYVLVNEDALVEVVADMLEATVDLLGAEIDSLEEIIKAQDEDTVGLLETIESQEEEIDTMTHYIAELEQRLVLAEIKNFFYELNS